MTFLTPTVYIKDGYAPDKRKKVIKGLITLIEKSRVKFDGVAARGVSGLLFAPIIADHFDKTIIVSRKKGEDSHASEEVAGDGNVSNYIIVDDLIGRGNTMRNILSSLKDAKCVGIFLYAVDNYIDAKTAAKFQEEQIIPVFLLDREGNFDFDLFKEFKDRFNEPEKKEEEKPKKELTNTIIKLKLHS